MFRKNAYPYLVPRLDGFFDARHNLSELSAIAAAGFNNVRAWSSFWAWVADPPGYRATLREFAANCRRLGLSVTLVLWNHVSTADISARLFPSASMLYLLARYSAGSPRNPSVVDEAWVAAYPAVADAITRGLIPLGEPWYSTGLADPGVVVHRYSNLAHLQSQSPDFVNLMADYVADTAQVLDGAGLGWLSYDLFNEPDYDRLFLRRAEMYRDIIAHTFRILRASHSLARPHYTVGFAGLTEANVDFMRDLVRRGVGLSYVSSHAYRTIYRLPDFVATIRRNARTAQLMGMDYVCSEFWERRLAFPLPAPLRKYLFALMAQVPRVGGQMWGFLENNFFFKAMDDPRHQISSWRKPVPIEPPSPRSLRFSKPEAVDGIIRPSRGQWHPGTPWPSQARMEQSGPETDYASIRLWGSSW